MAQQGQGNQNSGSPQRAPGQDSQDQKQAGRTAGSTDQKSGSGYDANKKQEDTGSKSGRSTTSDDMDEE